MKLTLVSIVINGTLFSKFVFARDGKVDINKAFPFLHHTVPHGTTITIG